MGSCVCSSEVAAFVTGCEAATAVVVFSVADTLFERQDDVASVAYWYQAEPHNTFPVLMDKEERWPR